MSYKERYDKRAHNECRPMSAKVGVVKNATGSAEFRIGKTWAIAAVYGPKELHPKFMQQTDRGIIRCNYNMMPFAGHGERVRPGTSRRSKEIGMVIEKALNSVVDLSDWPKTVIDIFIELPQTDAGTRCAGICAASMALAHAGVKMKELVTAVSVGKVGTSIVADLTYEEEHFPGEGGSTDIAVAVLSKSKKVTLLQLDGEVSQDQLMKALELAVRVSDDLIDIQTKALKEFYGQ